MSTEKIADRFHRESLEGVDAVLDRMCRAIGAPLDLGWAESLDVSRDTVKTWRRRGEVPLKFLAGFAKEHGLSLDYLRFGTEVQNEPDQPCLPPPAKGRGSLDMDALELAIEYVRNRERLEKKQLVPAKFARAVRLAYEVTLDERKGETTDAAGEKQATKSTDR